MNGGIRIEKKENTPPLPKTSPPKKKKHINPKTTVKYKGEVALGRKTKRSGLMKEEGGDRVVRQGRGKKPQHPSSPCVPEGQGRASKPKSKERTEVANARKNKSVIKLSGNTSI